MAINADEVVKLIPFSDRPVFGSPYPEGMAVAHVDITGDASGGSVVFQVQTPAPSLYRLEMLSVTRSDQISEVMEYTTHHTWAEQAAGFIAGAYTLNWISQLNINLTFTQYSPRDVDLAMIRRFPIGSTRLTPSISALLTFFAINTNLVNYDFDAIFTYWPIEALYIPGFLSSFYESPIVAPGQ